MADSLLEYMKKNGIELSREKYIALAYGSDHGPLTAEEEAELPKEFQIQEAEPPTADEPLMTPGANSSQDSDDQSNSDEADRCPECGVPDCKTHLLATLDLSGEGELSVGIVDGALFELKEFPKALNLIALAWVKSATAFGRPVPPEWIAEGPLLAFFRNLGPAGNFDATEYDNEQDAAWDLEACTEDYLLHARELLEEMAADCGWVGDASQRTDRQFDAPMMSTVYQSWWHPDPQMVTDCMAEKLRAIIVASGS